tara:strand:- start:4329 stop:5435 length:1107 start_codon:yes stop_codon:yes gene_type:complete
MEPTIANVDENLDFITFTLTGVNVSIANAIRRIIISEIPCFVFRTTPNEDNKISILKNTSRLNNEIIKQRLSCIPININDLEFNYKDHTIEIDLVNDTNSIKYVTTEDIKIFNNKTNSYLSKSIVNNIFPPDKHTNDYIDILRLRPKISDTIHGEHIKLNGDFDIGTAKQNSCFNVASTCSYKMTQNILEANKAWLPIEQTLLKENKDIELEKHDWMAIDGKRFVIPDSFDFIIETVGQYTNKELVIKACNIIINKMNNLTKNMNNDQTLIVKSDTTIPNSFDVILYDEDYTLGKVIEYILHDIYFKTNNILSFCGFKKEHPHIDKSIIRIAFNSPSTESDVFTIFSEINNRIDTIFTIIASQFNEKV